MRYVVYGAGAVGGTIGLLLHEQGADVRLVARGAHGAAIARDGLELRTPERRVRRRIPVAERLADGDLQAGDVVILTVKSQDTESALAPLVVHAPPDIAVVCAQNGVVNERVALRRFPNVYGIPVMLPSTRIAPGVIAAHSHPTPGMLNIGRYPAGVDAVADAVARDLRAAGFRADPLPDVMRWKYAKLLRNLANAVEAVCGTDARRGTLYKTAREEGVAALDAAGIAVTGDDEWAAWRAGVIQARPVDGLEQTSSSWQSLALGSGSIETDALNGEIVLLGRLHGVPVPVNAALCRLAARLARQGAAPGTLTEAQVLAEAGVD